MSIYIQKLRTLVRDSLLQVGWDLRRTQSYQAEAQDKWEQRELAKWNLLKSYAPRTILDIGANTGQFAHLVRKLLPTCRVISFEPIRECFEELLAREATLAPFAAYHMALGSEDAMREIYRNEFSPSSSLLEMNPLHRDEAPFACSTQGETIQVRRLDGLIHELNLEDPVFVKIDVQGYTEQVMRGGESVIRRATAVVAEVSVRSLYEKEATFDRLYEMFRQWGFVYCGNVDQWSSSRDGRILQCDCLFEKTASVSTC